jgi:AcrR family transcriptional regulator
MMSDLITESVWLRPPRPGRGEQPSLGREPIVKAAIALLDAEGLAGLSMRRLGAKLGSGATSLYWYVANKDELLELTLDEVMGEVYLPEVDDTDWRTACTIFATSMRAMLLRHPWVPSLFGVRPNIGPNSMRLSDRAIAVLVKAGFTDMAVAHASSLLMSHALGSAITTNAVNRSTRHAGKTINELFKELEPYLDRIAVDHADYQRWWQGSGGSDLDHDALIEEGFGFGLERLLDGLELWLNRPSPDPRTR